MILEIKGQSSAEDWPFYLSLDQISPQKQIHVLVQKICHLEITDRNSSTVPMGYLIGTVFICILTICLLDVLVCKFMEEAS